VLSKSTVFFCTGGGAFLYRFRSQKRQTLARGHTGLCQNGAQRRVRACIPRPDAYNHPSKSSDD
jgi:hypothetical protein